MSGGRVAEPSCLSDEESGRRMSATLTNGAAVVSAAGRCELA